VTAVVGAAPPSRPGRPWWRLAVESVLAGLGYGALLCWLGTCLVGSFRPGYMANPYWPSVPGLRTDTCGIAAFTAAAISLACSEYLRLDRQRVGSPWSKPVRANREPIRLAALAVAETVTVLGTLLVAYLSVNAVTHPATLAIRATHLAPWPTEGTLRVIALFACACGVGVMRWIWVSRS
jgi:hypothetical protein